MSRFMLEKPQAAGPYQTMQSVTSNLNYVKAILKYFAVLQVVNPDNVMLNLIKLEG